MRTRARLYVRAFTLVELSVSLAVIMLLTAVLLSRYPETATRLTLANANHTVSLLVREAQVRGSAIDSAGSTLGGYGVYVSLDNAGQLILFGDTVDLAAPKPYGIAVGNGLYETSPVGESKSVITLPSRYVVSKLCVGTGFPFTCNSSHSPAITSLTISFIRPNPMPLIYINNSDMLAPASAACIELRSPQAPLTGHVRSVHVFSSGLIRSDIGKCDNSSS